MTVELGSAVGKVEIDAAGVAKGIEDAKAGLAGAKASLESIGPAATRAGQSLMTLGAPLVAFGGIAAKTAADFEGQMNILAVAARDSGASLDDLRNVAIQAGADVSLVGVSASDVAGAMTGFTKAGLSVNETLGNMQGYLAGTVPLGGALRAAIDLAAASELDLAQASDLVTITMSTFGLTAEEVVGKIGNYVQAADASVASVGDLGEAMRNVGPTMAAFGFSLEDTNTALAILSTRGIQGAEAGTALKSMFTNMMNDTKETRAALSELNLELYDQAGNMRPLPDIVAQLSRALSGLTEEQRNQYVQTLAGSYGMKAMNTLLAEGVDGWREMETAVAGAATMQESAAAQTKGFNAAMENLKSSVETFLITVGTPLINDVLTPLVRVLADVAGALAGMNPEWLKWGVIIGGVVTALGGGLVVFGQVAGAITSIQGLVALLSPLFAGLAAAIGPAVAGIVAAIAPIALPILAVVAAIALLYLAWKNNWLGIRDWVQEIVPQIGAFLASAWEWMQATAVAVWTAISEFFSTTWTTISTTATAIWTGIQAAFVTITTATQTTITMIWTAIQTTITTIWTAIQAVATAIWDGIRLHIETVITILAGVIRATMQVLQGDFIGAWNTMKETAVTVVGNLRDGILNILGGLVEGVYEKGAALAQRFGEGIRSALDAAFNAAKAIADRIRALLPGSDADEGPLSDLFASGRALPVTLGAGIGQGAAAAVNAARQMAAGLAGALPGAGPDLAGALAGYGPPPLGQMPGGGGQAAGGKGQVAGGTTGQTINVTIHNPVGEPAEQSLVRQLRNLAYVGVLQPV